MNCKSILNDLDYFHVADNQLPQDIMHILLEGVIPYTIKIILKSFIVIRKLFTLTTLNRQISSFIFSRSERRDKPSLLIDKNLQSEGHINQTGMIHSFTSCTA